MSFISRINSYVFFFSFSLYIIRAFYRSLFGSSYWASLNGLVFFFVKNDEQKVQAKVDNKGVISANYILQIRPQIKGVLSAQIDAKNAASDTSKFGVSMIIG